MRANSLEKILMLGKIEKKRRRGQQKMRWLDSVTVLLILFRMPVISLFTLCALFTDPG